MDVGFSFSSLLFILITDTNYCRGIWTTTVLYVLDHHHHLILLCYVIQDADVPRYMAP